MERHHEPERGFGRDGLSGLVDRNRAMRARDVSRPSADDLAAARRDAEETIARLEGAPALSPSDAPG